MKQNESRIVVVRKKRSSAHQEEHGSWKIAYADFMTAMMAFFLVMWLISISTPKELEKIAEYFRMPLRVALSGGQRSSDSESPVPGGGQDVTRKKGEVDKTDAARSRVRRAEDRPLKKLKQRLETLLLSDPRLKELRPHLLITMASQGLRVQIIDSQQRPMFRRGSADVEPYMRTILRAIAPILNDVPNKISIAGHTDDYQYQGGDKGFSNWELSADRANASRRELVRGGLNSGKVLRVLGMADTMKLSHRQGDEAQNRRISLLVLNLQAEHAIEAENREGQGITLSDPAELHLSSKTESATAPATGGLPGSVTSPSVVGPGASPGSVSTPSVPAAVASPGSVSTPSVPAPGATPGPVSTPPVPAPVASPGSVAHPSVVATDASPGSVATPPLSASGERADPAAAQAVSAASPTGSPVSVTAEMPPAGGEKRPPASALPAENQRQSPASSPATLPIAPQR